MTEERNAVSDVGRSASPSIATAAARSKLDIRTAPYFIEIKRGELSLGYRKNVGSGNWVARRTVDKRRRLSDSEWSPGRYETQNIGAADDAADGTIDFDRAKARAWLWLQQAITMGRRLPAVTLEERIKQKWLTSFIDIPPVCCLYRQYGPSGDLLYAGITLSTLDRHQRHRGNSSWGQMIACILIEPFASREEAKAAEAQAIREEFPRFNRQHNERRQPLHELRSVSRKLAQGGNG